MELREAAQQALEALCLPCDRWNRRQTEIINASITTLRAALAEEKNENTVQSTGGVHSRVSDGANRGVEAVTDCHEKAADHVPETKFGNMAQSVDCYGDGNVYHTNGMPAVEGPLSKAHRTCQESRQVEPVAWLFQHEETGLTECVDVQQVEWGFERNNPLWQKIGPLYTAPPKRKPLTDCGEAGHDEGRCGNASCITRPQRKPLDELVLSILIRENVEDGRPSNVKSLKKIARAVERAHGIGGEE